MLLYIIEGAVPVLTGLFLWAAYLALKKNIQKHKKVAISHALATWASTVLVMVLVRLGFTTRGHSPEWIMDIHLTIIYTIPVMLLALMATALTARRKAHISLALLYSIIWTGALVTGAIIFAIRNKWL